MALTLVNAQTRQDKTRQDKTRQDKTRQDKITLGEIYRLHLINEIKITPHGTT